MNRLHALCPYFAMFPADFVASCVNEFTHENDLVYDPFSGRGTTVFQSLLMGRRSIASDINPVAFCIFAAKAHVPSLEAVTRQINQLERMYGHCQNSQIDKKLRELPSFFHRAFHPSTLKQILFLRRELNWQDQRVHRFIAALVLGSLHGEMDKSSSYFSNRMPRTICTKPGYSLRYWRSRDLWPAKRDVFDILRKRAILRLREELPELSGNVKFLYVREAAMQFPQYTGQVNAVVTSRPYFDVTSAEEDQWLRLWFLRNQPYPTYNRVSKYDRHCNKKAYWNFLGEAWRGISTLLRPNAVLVCRLGAKDMTEDESTEGLLDSIRAVFHDAKLARPPIRTDIRKRQTDSFRPGSEGCRFEIDYAFLVS